MFIVKTWSNIRTSQSQAKINSQWIPRLDPIDSKSSYSYLHSASFISTDLCNQNKSARTGKYLGTLCHYCLGLVFCVWMSQCFLRLELKKILLFSYTKFLLLFHISFNFWPTKIYHTPIWRKFHEDSAECNGFALAALELQPRKPVHFFMTTP